jgi:hypothetical protein
MRTANILILPKLKKNAFTIIKSSCVCHGLRAEIDPTGYLKFGPNDQMFKRDVPKEHLYIPCCVQLLL